MAASNRFDMRVGFSSGRELVSRVVDWRLIVGLAVSLTVPLPAQQFGVAPPQPSLTITPGMMTTLAGTGVSGHIGDGGPAVSAEVTNGLRAIAADADGDVYFVDDSAYTIRVVYEGGAGAARLITAENPSVTAPAVGAIYDVAGIEGSSGTPANGVLGTSAKLKPGAGLSLDAAGDVYFNDTGTNKVWVVYAGGSGTPGTNFIALETGVTSPVTGTIYGIAGNLSAGGYAGNGVLATSSGVQFHGINDMKLDAAGDLFIVDQGNCAIREVSASNGYLSTVAGTGACGVQPNNGQASSTELGQPYGIAIDASGNLYIADKGSVNQIRMVYAGGSQAAALIALENPTITNPQPGYLYAVAGGGSKTYPYGGLAISSKLSAPTMVALDAAGDIYIADNSVNVIDEVNPITGEMTVIAGNSKAGYTGDGGPALNASMNGLRGVAVDAAGRIYITDATNLRVREVSQSIVVFPGQAPNTTSAPKTVQVSNTGNAELDFTGGVPVFAGPNAVDFAVDTSSALNTCNFTPLQPAGSCILALTYSPTTTNSSTATLSFTTNGVLSPQTMLLEGQVLPATNTSLAASTSNPSVNSTVTLTATVTGTASPTGSVTFSSQSGTLGTAPLSSGVATFTYTPTTTGNVVVSASYSGDDGNAPSISTTVTLNVTGSAASSTAMVSSASSINQGQNVNLTATVSGGATTPTGSVVFSSGSTNLGTVALNNGVATLSTTAIPIGPNTIQALYLGDATYAVSSATTEVQVHGVPTVVLTASAASVNLGVPETLTAAVSGTGVVPTGNVTIYSNGAVLATVPLSGGLGVFTTSRTALPADGTYMLTASYSGDSSYNAGSSAPVTITVSGRFFVHPGGLHTVADLNRMATEVGAGAHPWIDDWNLLIQDPQAQSTYKAKPLANMGDSRQQADADSHAAYLNAIEWYIYTNTGNAALGTAHANAAMNILNQWAATVNQVPKGTDVPGLIGIPIDDFALAGEVLRSYSGWSPSQFAAFQNMFTNYLYPAVNDFLTNHNGACISHYWANWDAANVASLISMGVLNDNTSWFNQGVSYYESGPGNGSMPNAVYYVWQNNSVGLGQWQEAGRDQEHAQLGVGLLSYAAQAAWNQGVDLFSYDNNRLLAGAEYVSQYNTNFDVPYVTYNNCDNVEQYYVSADSRDRLDRPVWELIYNHYNVIEGLPTPNSQTMAQLMRPDRGSGDHFGYETLTFTLDATASPYPPSPAPSAPAQLAATPAIGLVYLNWSTSATANGYIVLRSTDGQTYSVLASLAQSTLTQYIDSSVTAGTTYYYEVEASNQSGSSAPSAVAIAVPAAPGALPSNWLDADIGSVQTPGSAQYSAASANNFLVTGQGSRIGSTDDSFNYAYTQVTGDFVLIARVAGFTGNNLNNTGLVMRSDLTSGAMSVAMVDGSTGARIAAMGVRSTEEAGTAWTYGSQYTYMPVWFRLQRQGNVFTAAQSADGITWFTVGTATVSMPNTYYVGLAACSGDTSSGTTETTNFDHVSAQSIPAIAWPAPPAISYGTALGSAQLDATSPVSGSFTYTPAAGTVLSAGTHTLSVTFTPNDDADFTGATQTVQIVVNPATPAIIWPAPAPIVYGTALTTTQLDASAGGVQGTFSYTPAAGTVLSAGTQMLSVVFTPNDTANYTTATQNMLITVNTAPATITLANLAQTYSGNPEPVTATVTPAHCGPVAISYNSNSSAPASIGTYSVIATLSNPSCTAPAANGTLLINAFAASGCIYTLDPAAAASLSVSGNATLNARCGIQVNSGNKSAFSVSGAASVGATGISVVGGDVISSHASVNPAPQAGAPTVADPLAGVQAPAVSTMCDYNNWHNASSTLNPGTYCGGISISGGLKVTFNPGTYILLGGGLKISGGSDATGDGVTFYNTGNSSYAYQPIIIAGASQTKFAAPDSGSLAGVLFFQDRSVTSTAANLIAGGDQTIIQGALYFPTTPLVFSGGSVETHGAYTMIVADTIALSGNSSAFLTTLGQ